jgi:16S rRNA processing protein RimM
VVNPPAPPAAKKAASASKKALPAAEIDTSLHWVEVARLGRPHGVLGELRAQLYNPDSPLWQKGLVLRVHAPGRPDALLTMIDLRPGTGCLLMEFKEIRDRNGAAMWTNAVLLVSEAQLPAAGDDEVYLHELIGADVIEAETGEVAGKVERLIETNVDLLQIRWLDGSEALIPVEADSIESLGREKGRIVVRHLLDWKS